MPILFLSFLSFAFWCCYRYQLCPIVCKPINGSTLGFPVLSPRVCSNSCPLSQWGHPPVSASIAPFSSYPQSLPGSWSFPVIWLFASGGQSTGASASASVLLMNIQDWLPKDWLVWSPCCPRDPQESSPTPQFKSITLLWHSPFFMVQLSHPYMTTGKTTALTRRTFVG